MSIAQVSGYINLYGDYMKYYNSKATKGNSSQEKKADDIVEITSQYGDILELSDCNFNSIDELMAYLSQNYNTVSKGMVDISESYLKECLNDESKLRELYGKLEDADNALEDAEKNVKGFQKMEIHIDEEGNTEYEISGGSVVFNQAKRARQLAAASTPAEVRMVLGLLTNDLTDCKSGLAKGMCDESEVQKVMAMLQKAQQRMTEVSADDNKDNNNSSSSFYINMLM